MAPNEESKVELLEYEADWPVYGVAWRGRSNDPFRLALGSFKEDSVNIVRFIELDKEKDTLQPIAEFEHTYPATKVAFMPDPNSHHTELVATTSDALQIWELSPDNKVHCRARLSNNRSRELCAPLTSFDWNVDDANLVATASIDTTCTVWNIDTQQAVAQLIAHDREVYDLAFAQSPNVFASVSADGSVRLFDLRRLEDSTIIYETPDMTPLMRIAWNRLNPNHLAALALNSPRVSILDIRVPSRAIAELKEPSAGRGGSVNAVAWAPKSAQHLCSAGEAGRAVIWECGSLQPSTSAPILSYDAGAAIDNLAWSVPMSDWIALAVNSSVKVFPV